MNFTVDMQQKFFLLLANRSKSWLTGDSGDAGSLEEQLELAPAHLLDGVAEDAFPGV